MSHPTSPGHPGPGYLAVTRSAYDTVAADYADLLRDELAGRPLDRALLAAFADLVRLAGDGPVAEAGCGPGRVTAHLAGLGLTTFGVDLSAGMLAAWYSIIHTPPEHLGAVFAEFHRVLRPGAELILAFQAGDEKVHLSQAYGHSISLDAYRLSPTRVEDLLAAAGLVTHTRVLRDPGPREKTPQAYLLARRVRPGGSGHP